MKSATEKLNEFAAKIADYRLNVLTYYLDFWVIRVDGGFELARAAYGYAPMTGDLLALLTRFCLHYQPDQLYKREHIWLTFDDVKVGGIHLNYLPPWDVKEDDV